MHDYVYIREKDAIICSQQGGGIFEVRNLSLRKQGGPSFHRFKGSNMNNPFVDTGKDQSLYLASRSQIFKISNLGQRKLKFGDPANQPEFIGRNSDYNKLEGFYLVEKREP